MDSLPEPVIEFSYEEEIVVIKKGYGRGKYERPPDLHGMTGKWTKWGRVIQGFQEAVSEEWTCQSCANKQPKDLTPYLHDFNGETLRVCAICINNGCKDLLERVNRPED